MGKDRESITIDKEVNQMTKEEAKKQKRSFSGMVQFILSEYFSNKKS